MTADLELLLATDRAVAAGGDNLAVAAGADGKGQYIVAAGPQQVTVFRQKSSNPASP